MSALGMACCVVLMLWSAAYSIVNQEGLRRLRAARNKTTTPNLKPHRWVVLRPTRGKAFVRTPAMLLPHSSAPMRFIYLTAINDEEAQRHASHAVQTLRAQGNDAEMLMTKPFGRNGKAAQLAQVPYSSVQDSLVVSLDDDICAATVNLDAAAELLQSNASVAAVWMPFLAQKHTVTLADRIAQSSCNDGPHAFVLLAALAPHNMTGKVMMYRPDLVRAAGGWEKTVAWYGDDLALAKALLGAGCVVAALPAQPATMTRSGQTFSAIWQRQHRWARIIIDQRPALAISYVWYMGAAPLLLCCWLVMAWAWPWAVCGALAVLFSRIRLLMGLERGSNPMSGQTVLLALAADCFLLMAFLAAMAQPTVQWAEPVDAAANDHGA